MKRALEDFTATVLLAAALFGAALLAAAPHALAATVDQRSPFVQGHWWSPERSGSGFDIFAANGEAMAIWYTYDAQGKPVWYTAQGRVSTLGSDWPILKHRWANGRKAGFTQVGTLRLDVRAPSLIDVSWRFEGGPPGTARLEPFRVSVDTLDVDRSGSWFDAANSGWGLNVTEQGDVLGGVLFTYDTAGEPLWLAGFEPRANNATRLALFEGGACPDCTYRAPTPGAALSITLESTGDSGLTLRGSPDVPMAAGVTIVNTPLSQLSIPASQRLAERTLAGFSSAQRLQTYMRDGLLNAPVGTPIEFKALVDGFDEANLVQTDGRFLYTTRRAGTGTDTYPELRVVRLDDQGATAEVLAPVRLATKTVSGLGGLYLLGSTLAHVSSGDPGRSMPFTTTTPDRVGGTTDIELLSLANPAAPASRWVASLDGYYVASARIGDRLHVLTRFVPDVPGFTFVSDRATKAAALAAASDDRMLPQLRTGGTVTPLVDPATVLVPPLSALPFLLPELLVVTTIDLAGARVTGAVAITARASSLDAGPQGLHVVDRRNDGLRADGSVRPAGIGIVRSDIYRIAPGSGVPQATGTASVAGAINASFAHSASRMHQQGERLAIITTLDRPVDTANRLAILEPSPVAPGLLRATAYLPNARRPEPLGLPTDLIGAARFDGDRLFMATTMSLYSVDLANAADPKIAGRTDIASGYLGYLHLFDGGRLFGVGYESEGRDLKGLRLSLFDVSQPANPQALGAIRIGDFGSESAVLSSPLAFAATDREGGITEVAIPVRLHDPPLPPLGNTPWKESGVVRYALQGSSLSFVSMLRTVAATDPDISPIYPVGDPTRHRGRTLLLPKGLYFVGDDRIWRQDISGVTYAPF